ncbi:MAG: hypothetical protein V4649_04745 [Bacteroidota bacterium]
MILRSKYLLLLLPCLLATRAFAQAQQYKVKAPLEQVTTGGFYAIDITPEMTAHAKADLADLRIADSAGSFVPYIVRKRRQPQTQGGTFTEFPVYRNTTDSSYTIVELENTLRENIAGISLVLQNTAVERYTTVSGSDDKARWYIIDDKILFHRSYNNTNGTYLQTINFPVSAYRYFRLKIYNEHTDPLHIVKAGHYATVTATAAQPEFESNPAPVVTQKDSSGISYITIQNAAPYLTNRFTLNITGAKYYQRNATVYIQAYEHDSVGLQYPVVQFTLTSARPAVVDVPAQKAYAIRILIENKDDPPLTITAATTQQEKQQMVAWLEPGNAYSLLAGNPSASTPQYDLSHFRDSIPMLLPVVNAGPFTAVAHTVSTATKAKGNSWLWSAIVIAVLLLGALTYGLMRDLKGKGV